MLRVLKETIAVRTYSFSGAFKDITKPEELAGEDTPPRRPSLPRRRTQDIFGDISDDKENSDIANKAVDDEDTKEPSLFVRNKKRHLSSTQSSKQSSVQLRLSNKSKKAKISSTTVLNEIKEGLQRVVEAINRRHVEQTAVDTVRSTLLSQAQIKL